MKKSMIIGLIAIMIGACAFVFWPKSSPEKSVDETTLPKSSFKGQVTTMYDNYYIPEGVDTVTEATAEDYSAKLTAKYTLEEKAQLMKWSTVPSLNYIHGDYYAEEMYFDGNYLAQLKVVVQAGKIVHLQFDELAPSDYYMEAYRNRSKRFSDYAFIQFQNKRTDYTLVTWVNGITFVEKQMIEENRLSGNFKTLKGSSNSARRGFIPLANRMAETIKQPSPLTYDALALEVEPGVYARLEIISENGFVKDLIYDEILGEKETIEDESLKPYFRQSKYHSIGYNLETGDAFKIKADEFKQNAINKQVDQLQFDGHAQVVYDALKLEMNKE